MELGNYSGLAEYVVDANQALNFRLFIHLSFIYLFIHSYIHLLIYLFIYLFFHSFILSFNYSFIPFVH